jgi:dihydroorotase
MRIIIKSGRVVDPAGGIEDINDVLVSDGKIEKIARDIKDNTARIVDASGMIVAPGLVDMHAHLREPGREDKETIKSGTRAAVRGGFTSVACMPNTEPAIDNPKAVKIVNGIIKKGAFCNVFVIGAVTAGRAGKKLADIAGMRKAGIVAVSDDGSPVDEALLLNKGLRACKKQSIVLISHCEDRKISGKGVMNKGFVSTKMGLRGIPREAECEMVKRDVEIAKKCAASIHIAHVSCAESADIIRKAKKRGIKVTAETAPHYFSLTDECCATYDTNTKMSPPLRSSDDTEAIKRALADGTIDVIATDHAPHTDSEKDVEFDFAPFGIIGLETALGLSVAELVDKKILSWIGLIEKLSVNPAAILGVDRGSLKKGSVADIVIIDPAARHTYKKEDVESRSKNSPFIGWELKSRVVSVFVGGKIVMEGGVISERAIR